MSETIIIALISLCGTLCGTFGGIMATSKLTNYRIEQLEKKVDKHNNLIERMYKAEDSINILDEKIKVVNHRIEDLEEGKC
jgi:ABC-type lipoprotein release transport system permease subunit